MTWWGPAPPGRPPPTPEPGDPFVSVTRRPMSMIPSRISAWTARVSRKSGRGLGLLAVIVIVVLPLVALLQRALQEPSRVADKLGGYDALWPALINTFLLAIGSVALTLVMATILAWCTVHLPNRRLAGLAATVGVAPLAMPMLPAVVGWSFLFSPRIGYGNQLLRATPWFGGTEGPINVYGIVPIVLVTSISLVSFVYVFVLSALRNVDPSQEAAARVFGASWWQAQRTVVLPSVRPALAYGTVVVLLLGLGQFTAPLLLGEGKVEVITTLIFRETQAIPPDYGFASLLALPLLLTAAVFIVVQQRVVGAMNRYRSTTKGSGGVRKSRVWPILPVLFFGGIAVLPPLLGLAIVGMSPYWQADPWSSLSLTRLLEAYGDPVLQRTILNTLKFATGGTALVLVVSVGVGLILHRSRGIGRNILDYLVTLPLAVPGIIFGMGIFVVYALGPFGLYGSSWLFILAYVVVTLPHGVRTVVGGLAQIGETAQTAARVAGAGFWAMLRTVLLPLLRSSLASGAILAFIIMVQEFSAAALLSTSQNEVLSTRLYSRWNFGSYPDVAAIALAMVVVSLVGVLVILSLGGRTALERASGRQV